MDDWVLLLVYVSFPFCPWLSSGHTMVIHNVFCPNLVDFVDRKGGSSEYIWTNMSKDAIRFDFISRFWSMKLLKRSCGLVPEVSKGHFVAVIYEIFGCPALIWFMPLQLSFHLTTECWTRLPTLKDKEDFPPSPEHVWILTLLLYFQTWLLQVRRRQS